MFEQAVRLEDQPGGPAVDAHGAGERFEAGDRPEDGGLARSGWPGQRDDRAARDVEIDVLDDQAGAPAHCEGRDLQRDGGRHPEAAFHRPSSRRATLASGSDIMR